MATEVGPAPEDFARFEFAGYERYARLLSNYLWHHFRTRGSHGPVLFNKEYLVCADSWMAGAITPKGESIQAEHARNLSSVLQDEEGYICTHQHFSHAHDLGWPFPLWTQTPPAGDKPRALGWHFQEGANHPGWIWGALSQVPDCPWYGQRALAGWELHQVHSLGIQEDAWELELTGPDNWLVTPASASFEADCSPYVQLRWQYEGDAPAGWPCLEWLREQDAEFSAERRVYFDPKGQHSPLEAQTGFTHCLITLYKHPLWEGRIERLRLRLAPGVSKGKVRIDSFFCVYDTRHTINNPIFILACWRHFLWTRDLGFLAHNLNRMRRALRYQQHVLGGLEHKHIRLEWPGHDGLPGFTVNPDGSKTLHPGHGIGANYWDLLPFGWDDLYATNQYYASLLAMAEVEEAVAAHPEWNLPGGAEAFEPAELRAHAAEVKEVANRKFWNPSTGRFVACIDKAGNAHDYGFTFLNLDAIWYGLATDEHARAILDWLTGKRVVEGDTSQGADLYHWRFGPRATTRRNVEWYGWYWSQPEVIPWGGQVQDGGSVLGFSFYDLWARLQYLGPDDAWQRLSEIMEWEDEVQQAGGYRAYYEGGKRGTTMQGCGTAGGLGIDCEFHESSLLPSIVTYGFLGLQPSAEALRISPKLPGAVSTMGVHNLFYLGARLNLRVGAGRIEVELVEPAAEPLQLQLPEGFTFQGRPLPAQGLSLAAAGKYLFTR